MKRLASVKYLPFVLVLSTVILLGSVGYFFWDTDRALNEACEAVGEGHQVLGNILILAYVQGQSDQQSQEQRRATESFFNQSLALINDSECPPPEPIRLP